LPSGFSGDWSGTVAPGGSREVSITFSPNTLKNYSGTVAVSSDATSGTNTCDVSGRGIGRVIRLAGDLAFGDVAVGGSDDRILTIHNDGNVDFSVSGLSVPDGFSGDWSGTVSSGNSHNVTITFSPSTTGSYSGDVTVASDKTSGTNTWAVTGTGTPPPTISVTPASRDFGSVEVGSTADQTFTVQNTGGDTLSGSASVPLPYSVLSGGTYSLTAGQNQALTVRYSPTSEGTHNRTVTFTGGSGVTRSVTGSTQNPPPQHTITASAGNNGSIDPSGDVLGTEGDNFLLTATADTGYLVAAWLVDGSEVQVGGASYTLPNIQENHAVSVTFRVIPAGFEGPSWWLVRNVIIDAENRNDFAAVNQGQLKWIATKAYEEFDAKLTGGAGSNVTALVNSPVNFNNYLTVNHGQLKNVAKPFYDRLWELGMTHAYPAGVTTQYPWDSSTNAPSDYKVANIGQLKYLFSFELEGGTNPDDPDFTAPSPDPLSWAIAPFADSASSISMTTATATDPSGVEYYFEETSGNAGGHDSGWQVSPRYEDSGLSPGTTYSYRVKARDLSSNSNETTWSEILSFETPLPVTQSWVWDFEGTTIPAELEPLYGTWDMSSGRLHGYWSLSSAYSSQGQCPVRSDLELGTNWLLTVWGDVGDQTRLNLYHSSLKQYRILVNIVNTDGDRTLNLVSEYLNGSGVPAGQMYDSFTHDIPDSGLVEYAIRRTGLEFEVLINGEEVASFTDTLFGGDVRPSFGAYGHVYYSQASLELNP